MKELLKKIIKSIPIAFTRNQQYDAQTHKVIQRICVSDSSCIDVGCHKGEVLDIFLKYAPKGIHYGFEPIPDMHKALKAKYAGINTKISDIALSNETGTTTFNYVVSNPAYSGLIKRKYDRESEIDTQITVSVDKLDNLVPSDTAIKLIKIDVEGGELLVLEGARDLIRNQKPYIIFEHGLGASEFYGSTPAKVFELLTGLGLKISTMKDWLANRKEFSLPEFERQYNNKINYYFIAYP
ncbi:MAG: FkbM family methyltransferase [Saprospiraceae bacterium]